MKVRNLFAASLAAMTFFSCSNEVEELGSAGAGLAPGDALISFDLGGKTTYSTTAKEGQILSGSAKLFKGGAELTLENVLVSGGKLTATVPGDQFAENDEASLYIWINGNPVETDLAEENTFKNATVETNLDYNLTAGIPASGVKTITLIAGTIEVPAGNLTRVASRVGATSADGNSNSIKDFQVEISNTAKAGYLFPVTGQTALTDAGTTLSKTLTGTITDMYGSSETVGYIYPKNGVKVKVTAKDGSVKEVEFDAKANKNYAIKITPMVPNTDGNFSWDITVDGWNADSEEVEVDFSKPGTPDNPDTPVDPTVDPIEKVLVDVNGVKWMPFNTSGNLATDQATATAIDAMPGDNLWQKIKAYAAANKEQFEKVAGYGFKHQQIKCPTGYRVAKLADFNALAGMTLPTTDAERWTESTTFPTGIRLMKETFEYPVTTSYGYTWYFAIATGNVTDGFTFDYLPFIGAHTNTQITENSSVIGATASGNGMALWTNEARGNVRERVSIWKTGFRNTTSGYTSSNRAYVRCIKDATAPAV